MDVRVQIPALFIDEVRDSTPDTDAAIINAVPEDGELGVPSTTGVYLQVVGFSANPIDTGALSVWLTRSSTGATDLVYTSGAFQVGYSGTVTLRPSIGAAVNDEAIFSITVADAFSTLEIITVRVETLIGGYLLDENYSFQIADETPPTILAVRWLSPTRCVVEFNEPINVSTLGYVYAADGITIESQKIIFRGQDLSAYTSMYAGVRGSDTVSNNKDWAITSVSYLGSSGISEVVPNATVELANDTGLDVDTQGMPLRQRALRGAMSYFKLESRYMDESGPLLEDAIQVSYAPLIQSISALVDAQLPPGGQSGAFIVLNFDEEVSFNRIYRLSCYATDAYNNSGLTEYDFRTPQFGLDVVSDVGFWTPGVLSTVDMQQDIGEGEGEGILRKQSMVFQDALNIARYRSEQLSTLHDPYLCPDSAVEFLLAHRANPFRFPLNDLPLMRKCCEYLPDLYRQKGTHTGIESFIRNVLGIGSEIIAFWPGEGWILDDPVWSILGRTTSLFPGEAYGRNCYDILVHLDLDQWERDAIREICEWSDPMGMHLIDIIEPSMLSSGQATIPGSTYWILGVSTLGNTTYLSP